MGIWRENQTCEPSPSLVILYRNRLTMDLLSSLPAIIQAVIQKQFSKKCLMQIFKLWAKLNNP